MPVKGFDAVDAEAIARELLAHPDLPHAFRTIAPGRPDPAREAVAVVLRTRHRVVDNRRRLLNEVDVLLGELPAYLGERRPGGSKVEPRLMAAARPHRTGDRVADLCLRLLRVHAQQARALARERDALEREISDLLKELGTSLPNLYGLGSLGSAQLLVEAGDPRRFRSADAFASYIGTAPIPASSAEASGWPVHHRLSRCGNRRLNSVLHIVAVTRLRANPKTQAFIARTTARGNTSRDALRIIKRRLARLVWSTMIHDVEAAS
jgi:transposase